MQPISILALLLPARAASPGDPIDEAVAVQISTTGLEHLGDAVRKLVPTTFPVDDLSGEYSCSDADAAPLTYSLDGIDLLLSADEVLITPSDGRLDLTLYATLSSTASVLTISGDCSVLTDLDEECGVEIPTTAVEAHLGMTIDMVEGEDGATTFDVVVEPMTLDISPVGNPLSDCTLSSAIGTMLAQDPEAISDLLLGLVEPSLDDLGPTIEQPLEDALNSLSIDTSFELQGVLLDLSIYPSLFELSDTGLVLGLGAQVDVGELSDCVDWSAGSQLAGAGWPDFAATASGTSLKQDAALYLSKDFVDHTLWMLWAGGLLCLDANEYVPGGLNAGLLSGVLDDDFSELFPEDAPISLLIEPASAPTVRFEEDGPPIRVDITGLGLPLGGELDRRDVRILQVDADAELAVDVWLDEWADTGGGTGTQLATELVFDPDDIEFQETYSDLLGPGYSEGLSSLVGTLIGGLLPEDALPSVDLPSLMGIGLGALVWLPTDDGAWQGGYLLLDTTGVQPITIDGCSVDGLGCDGSGGSSVDIGDLLGCSGSDTGCGGGCEDTTCSAQPGVVAAWRGRLGLLAFLGLAIGLRRRREDD